MTYHGKCRFCDQDVGGTDTRTPAFRITGWEARQSGQGGANHVIGRERVSGVVAHKFCAEEAIKKQRKGIARQQGFFV